MIECFIGLGGNFPGTFDAMSYVIHGISSHAGIKGLRTSRLFQTTPVSATKQALFLNAVCCFACSLSLENLWETLQAIEVQAGKNKKPKDAPRLIDIDLLFYGNSSYLSPNLIIPHPHWDKRLFVLAPLADLNHKSALEKLTLFINQHQEQVIPLKQRLPYSQL